MLAVGGGGYSVCLSAQYVLQGFKVKMKECHERAPTDKHWLVVGALRPGSMQVIAGLLLSCKSVNSL